MKNTKVVTVIVNRTLQELVLRVGNHNCELFCQCRHNCGRGEHKIEIDINWTYQEFRLEPATAGHVLQKTIFTSDDCCDFESMAVKTSEGHELGRSDKTYGYHSSGRATRFSAVVYSDPDHYCQTIPCGYCGRKWPHPTIDTLEGEY